jgi:hypothetical protein
MATSQRQAPNPEPQRQQGRRPAARMDRARRAAARQAQPPRPGSAPRQAGPRQDGPTHRVADGVRLPASRSCRVAAKYQSRRFLSRITPICPRWPVGHLQVLVRQGLTARKEGPGADFVPHGKTPNSTNQTPIAPNVPGVPDKTGFFPHHRARWYSPMLTHPLMRRAVGDRRWAPAADWNPLGPAQEGEVRGRVTSNLEGESVA